MMEGNKHDSQKRKDDAKAIKELYGALKEKQAISKPKLTYRDWFIKRGGWKRVGAAFAGLLLYGYIVDMTKTSKKHSYYEDAKMLSEQGIRPVEMGSQYSNQKEIQERQIKDKQDVAWGQSHLKGTERRD